MRVMDRIADLGHQQGQSTRRERLSFEPVFQGPTGEKLHHHETTVVSIGPDVKDPDNPRMVQSRRHAGLCQEVVDGVRGSQFRSTQNLDGHHAAQLFIFGEEDPAKPSGRQEPVHRIASDAYRNVRRFPDRRA